MADAVRIRADSRSHFQPSKAIGAPDRIDSTVSPISCASAVHRRPVAGSSRVTKEQGKCLPREISPKRPEPLPEDIAETLQNYQLEQDAETQDVCNRETATDTGEETPSAIAEQPISESAPIDATPATPSAPSAPSPAIAVTRLPTLVETSEADPSGKSRPKSLRKSRRASLTRRTSTTGPRRLVGSITPNTSLTPSPKPSRRPTSSIDRSSWDLAMSRPTSLLVASLGNPPPYHRTRHSAAHLLLRALQSSLSLPSFVQKSKPYGGGHVSIGADVGRHEFTLYQSSVQMNVSGPPLLKAWRHFTQLTDLADRRAGLVVLHDEMEIAPGQFKVRRGNSSARGHNGIKSVQAALQGAGLLNALGDRFVKIGVGIGRPAGGTRESKDVSAYVLGQLTKPEKEGLENAAGGLEGLLWQELARIGQSA